MRKLLPRLLPKKLHRLLPPTLRPTPSKLPPRERARAVVQSLQEATLDCLREQRHLIAQDRRQRQADLHLLAAPFIEGTWHPENVAREDIDVIPDWIIRSIVINTANGMSVAGYEQAIHELYQQLEAPGTPTPIQAITSMPQVSNPWRGGVNSRRRAYSRGKLPES